MWFSQATPGLAPRASRLRACPRTPKPACSGRGKGAEGSRFRPESSAASQTANWNQPSMRFGQLSQRAAVLRMPSSVVGLRCWRCFLAPRAAPVAQPAQAGSRRSAARTVVRAAGAAGSSGGRSGAARARPDAATAAEGHFRPDGTAGDRPVYVRSSKRFCSRAAHPGNRKRLVADPGAVLEVVAVQGHATEELALDLPSGAAGPSDLLHIAGGHRQAGEEGVAVGSLTVADADPLGGSGLADVAVARDALGTEEGLAVGPAGSVPHAAPEVEEGRRPREEQREGAGHDVALVAAVAAIGQGRGGLAGGGKPAPASNNF